MNVTTEAEKRARHVRALRLVADLLDAHPELPAPRIDQYSGIVWYFLDADVDSVRVEMAATARLLPTSFAKNNPADSGYDAETYTLTGDLHGIKVKLVAYRKAVCERVVTGTETVTRRVAAAPAVDAHEVTTEVETVEWVCTSLLAAAVAA